MLSYFKRKSDALFKGWIELQTKVRFFKTSVYTLKSSQCICELLWRKKKNIHTVLFYSIFPEHSFPRRIQHFRADSWMTFKVGSKSSYRLFRRKKKVKSPPKLKLSLKSENSQYVIAAYCELFKQLFTMLEPSFINLGNEVTSSLKHNKRFHFNVKASLKVT